MTTSVNIQLKKKIIENPALFKSIPGEFQNDEKLIISLIKKNGLLLKYLGESWRKKRNIVLMAVQQNSLAYQDALIQDDSILLEAIKTDGEILRFVTILDSHPLEIKKEAAKKSPRYISLVQDEIKIEDIAHLGFGLTNHIVLKNKEDVEQIINAATSNANIEQFYIKNKKLIDQHPTLIIELIKKGIDINTLDVQSLNDDACFEVLKKQGSKSFTLKNKISINKNIMNNLVNEKIQINQYILENIEFQDEVKNDIPYIRSILYPKIFYRTHYKDETDFFNSIINPLITLSKEDIIDISSKIPIDYINYKRIPESYFQDKDFAESFIKIIKDRNRYGSINNSFDNYICDAINKTNNPEIISTLVEFNPSRIWQGFYNKNNCIQYIRGIPDNKLIEIVNQNKDDRKFIQEVLKNFYKLPFDLIKTLVTDKEDYLAFLQNKNKIRYDYRNNYNEFFSQDYILSNTDFSNKEFLLQYLRITDKKDNSMNYIYKLFDKSILNDRSVLDEAVIIINNKYGDNYQTLPPFLKKEVAVIDKFIESDGFDWNKVPKEVKTHENILYFIEKNPILIKNIDPNNPHYIEYAKIALNKNPEYIIYLDTNYHSDPFVIDLFKENKNLMKQSKQTIEFSIRKQIDIFTQEELNCIYLFGDDKIKIDILKNSNFNPSMEMLAKIDSIQHSTIQNLVNLRKDEWVARNEELMLQQALKFGI